MVKKEKLVALAESVLDKPAYKARYDELFNQLKIKREEVINGLVAYTQNITEIKNKDYQKKHMPIVLHIHNLVNGTYHKDRFSYAASFCEDLDNPHIIDIGAGVINPFHEKLLKKGIKLVLSDYNKTMFQANKAIIKTWGIDATNLTHKTYNMDSVQPVGKYDVYVMLDSVEHCKNPTKFIKNLVADAPEHAKFILSLPICKNITLSHAHFIEWLTEKDALTWLRNCGLTIERTEKAIPNPSVDYFAQEIEGGYYNLLVRCRKTENTTSSLLAFVEFLNQARLIERTIYLKGSNKRENNFEHQYQLAMIAMYLINTNNLDLDISKCIQLALVHDVLEIYSGDMYFLRNSEEERRKILREESALKKIRWQFPECSLLNDLVSEYHYQASKEAIFIKSLDKTLPTINIFIEGGRSWREKGIKINTLKNISSKINDRAVKIYYDQLLELVMNSKAIQ